MQWLAQNWFWIVISVLFIAMHLFGHGGGGCGGHGGHRRSDKKDRDATDKSSSSTGHQH